MKPTSTALCLILIISCGFLVQSNLATVYKVGDAAGWNTGVDYGTWASGKTFLAGDSLVFNYPSGGHTVDEVTTADYTACTVGNAIKTDSSGATTVPLSAAGTRYFICGIPGHCGSGMKLSVTVKAAGSGSTSPSPTTTTSPTTSGTPATTTTTTTPPATPTANNLPSSSAALYPFVGLIVAWAAIVMASIAFN